MADLTPQIVVMGVSGSGKSTIGVRLAAQLGVPFGEGDDLHSPASVAKMAAGHALDDADRAPWLAAIGTWMRAQPGGSVVSCSALKRTYRDVLRAADPGIFFVHLTGDREIVKRRVSERVGHFMPASLVDSQFDALEPLDRDEPGVALDFALPIDELVARVLEVYRAL